MPEVEMAAAPARRELSGLDRFLTVWIFFSAIGRST